MGCPNCGGPLALVAPDKAERVTCPNCNSLLDVNQGNLTLLQNSDTTVRCADLVPAADRDAEGKFAGDVKFKIIGAVVRSVTIEGITYYWHEYLLYNPSIGFRWLVHSDNHWNFVEPVNPAEIDHSGIYAPGGYVSYNGTTFKIFQDAPAVVRICEGRVLLASRAGRNRSRDRLCCGAGNALAGSDRERGQLVARAFT